MHLPQADLPQAALLLPSPTRIRFYPIPSRPASLSGALPRPRSDSAQSLPLRTRFHWPVPFLRSLLLYRAAFTTSPTYAH